VLKYNGMKGPNDAEIIYLGEKLSYATYLMEQSLHDYYRNKQNYRIKDKKLEIVQINKYLSKFKETFLHYSIVRKGEKNTRSILKDAVIKTWNELNDLGVSGDTFYNRYFKINVDEEMVFDRLVLAKDVIENIIEELSKKPNDSRKKIVLLSTSIGLMGDPSKNSKQPVKEAHILKKERDILKRLGKKRSGVERDLLKNFGLVILDEYHRYFKNVDPSEEECKIKSIYDNENERENLKLLFISATPYRANKSHIDMETMNEDDKKNITVLPTFEQFAQLFCGGRKSSKDSLDEKYLKELDENYKKFSED
jgi:hypothetical protein